MTTILQNVGVLDPNTNKVTDEHFKKFVQDVIKKLKSGESTLPEGLKEVECTEKIEPVPGAEFIPLDDETKFPDFHKMWKEKYTATAQSIDAGGATPLAAAGIADPTAIGTDLGLDIDMSKVSLGQIFAYLVTAIPGGPVISALGLPAFDMSLMTDVKKQIKLPTKFPAVVKVPKFPPVPTLEMFDLKKYFDLGYLEKFRYDLNGYIDQHTLSLKLPTPEGIADPAVLLDFVSSPPDLPKKIIKLLCEQLQNATSKESKPLEGCDFQKAARHVLVEHSANMQAIVALGQTLGNGMLVNKISRNVISAGGLQFTKADEELREPTASSFIGTIPKDRPGKREVVPGKERSYDLYPGQSEDAARNAHQSFQLRMSRVLGASHKLVTNPIANQLITGLILAEAGGAGYGGGDKGGFAGHECPEDANGKPIEGPGYKCKKTKLKQSDGTTDKDGYVKVFDDPDTAVRRGLTYHLTKEVEELIDSGAADSDAPGAGVGGATFCRLICALRRRGNVGGFCTEAKRNFPKITNGDLGDAATIAPDKDDARIAADAEMIQTYSLTVYYQTQDMLHLLGKKWAMPLGTPGDAQEWFRKRYGYKRAKTHVGPYKDANTGWQPA